MAAQETEPQTRTSRDPFRLVRPKPREQDSEGPHDPWEGLAGALDVPLEKLRAGLAQTRAGIVLQGAEVRQINTGQAASRVSTSAGRLLGWSLHETTGAGTALVYLRDGRDATGVLVAVIALNARESARDNFMPAGLSFGEGLFVDVAAGTVEGAVYVGGAD